MCTFACTFVQEKRVNLAVTWCSKNLSPIAPRGKTLSTREWHGVLRQYLNFCTSKASKLSTPVDERHGVLAEGPSRRAPCVEKKRRHVGRNRVCLCELRRQYLYFCTSKASSGVRICTSVPETAFACASSGVSIRTSVPVKQAQASEFVLLYQKPCLPVRAQASVFVLLYQYSRVIKEA
jgi:hypothetical protein